MSARVPEKLCIFCMYFRWSPEEMWGTGSTMTGPMFTGGNVTCGKGHIRGYAKPDNEAEYRTIILQAAECPDYQQVEL